MTAYVTPETFEVAVMVVVELNQILLLAMDKTQRCGYSTIIFLRLV